MAMYSCKNQIIFFCNYLKADLRVADRKILSITIPVKPSRYGSVTPDRLLNEFDRHYRWICQDLLGRNYNRKRHLQPRTVVAFDRLGSRRPSTRADRYDVCPHLHALMSIDPRIWHRKPIEEIERTVSAAISKSDVFEEPHIQLGERDICGIRRQIGYIMKDALPIEGRRDRFDLAYDLWPQPKR